jgi:hypothetical protein
MLMHPILYWIYQLIKYTFSYLNSFDSHKNFVKYLNFFFSSAHIKSEIHCSEVNWLAQVQKPWRWPNSFLGLPTSCQKWIFQVGTKPKTSLFLLSAPIPWSLGTLDEHPPRQCNFCFHLSLHFPNEKMKHCKQSIKVIKGLTAC